MPHTVIHSKGKAKMKLGDSVGAMGSTAGSKGRGSGSSSLPVKVPRDGSDITAASTAVFTDPPNQDQKSVVLVIKFSDSSLEDLTIDVEDLHGVSVSSLRAEIRKVMGGVTLNRRLRLIHNGKVLNDKVDLCHEVLKGMTNSATRDSQTGAEAVSGPRVYVHCAVGDILSPEELARENEFDQRIRPRTTLPELRGFDQLRNSGFSDEDIAQLREQFSRAHGLSAGEDTTQMEEQWIETGVQDGPPDITLGGDYLDDLIGILTGMFFGILALYFLKENGIFSKRQQKALVAGMAVNFAFAFLTRIM